MFLLLSAAWPGDALAPVIYHWGCGATTDSASLAY